jgi:hypothetical protein
VSAGAWPIWRREGQHGLGGTARTKLLPDELFSDENISDKTKPVVPFYCSIMYKEIEVFTFFFS